jgi:ketosteroid isomerase-like protein
MMKKFLAAVLLALLVSPVFADNAAPAVAAPAADQAAPAADVKAKKAKPAGDEAGIKKTFKEFSEAWAAGDAKAIGALFTKESSIINPFGQEAWGREDIEKVVAGDLDMMKGSTHSVDNYKFHFVLSGFALVDATGTLSGLKNVDGSAAADKSVHIYAAMALRGAKWYFLALRPYMFMNGGTAMAAPAAAAPAAAPPAAPVAPAAAAPAAPPAPAVDVPVPSTK